MTKESHIWDYKDTWEYLEKVRTGLPPLIISVAITGGAHGKELNPNHPETPEEQVGQVYDAYKAGASIVHVHARDPQNLSRVSSDPERYRKINGLIREKCPDIVINNTTGGSMELPIEERAKSIEAMPELASLNCGPLTVKLNLKARKPPLSGRPEDVLLDTTMPITFGETEFLAKKMLEKGIKPELEVYNPGQFWMVENLINLKLLKKPYFIQFVMGFQAGILPTPKNLITMVDQLPSGSMFEVIGILQHQMPMIAMGIIMGGHVRTGMEDTPYYRKGELCRDNAQLVERIVRLARELGRDMATPKQTREMLGISQKPSQY